MSAPSLRLGVHWSAHVYTAPLPTCPFNPLACVVSCDCCPHVFVSIQAKDLGRSLPELARHNTHQSRLGQTTQLSTSALWSHTPSSMFAPPSPTFSEPSLIHRNPVSKTSTRCHRARFRRVQDSPLPACLLSAIPSADQVDGRCRWCGADVRNRPRLY